MQRNKALAFMGIDPRTAPTARDIKLAFNRRLLQLHPDKNLGNGEKTANKFKRMRKAFNSLTNKGQSDSDTSGSIGGSTLRRNRNGNRTRKNTHRKTHKTTTGK
jgi:DnaJ-class molecular chaperone